MQNAHDAGKIRECVRLIKERKIRLALAPCVGIGLLLFGGSFLAAIIAPEDLYSHPLEWLIETALFGIATFVVAWAEWRLISDLASELPNLLARCSAPEVAPEVISILRRGRRKYRLAAQSWVIRVLPPLGPEVREVLSAHDARLLTRALDPRDTELAAAILEILVHTGNQDTVRAIDSFIAQSLNTPAYEKARCHAMSCLERLQARLDSEATMNTLLRGADSPASADVLLRQSAEPSGQSEELLRASE